METDLVWFYNRAEKTSVLSELIQKTNAQEMKWIVMIILKGLDHIVTILNQ